MFLKKNKAKVLSQVKASDFDEIVLKIQELFRRNGMRISVEDIKSYKDWIFVDDGEKDTVQCGILDFDIDRVDTDPNFLDNLKNCEDSFVD